MGNFVKTRLSCAIIREGGVMIEKLSTLLAISVVLFASGAQADLNISNRPTKNMSCSGGLCTATAKNAILNVDDLTNMLATGDLTVKFGGGALAIQLSDGSPGRAPAA